MHPLRLALRRHTRVRVSIACALTIAALVDGLPCSTLAQRPGSVRAPNHDAVDRFPELDSIGAELELAAGEDLTPAERVVCVRYLGRVPSDSALRGIERLCTSATDPDLRRECAIAYGAHHSRIRPADVDVLARYVSDQNVGVVAAALHALTRIGPDASGALQEILALRDREELLGVRDIKSAAVAAVEAIGLRNEDQVAAFRDFEPPEFSRAYRTLRRGREGYRGRIGDPGGAQWAHSSSTVLGRLLTELETRLSESTGTDPTGDREEVVRQSWEYRRRLDALRELSDDRGVRFMTTLLGRATDAQRRIVATALAYALSELDDTSHNPGGLDEEAFCAQLAGYVPASVGAAPVLTPTERERGFPSIEAIEVLARASNALAACRQGFRRLLGSEDGIILANAVAHSPDSGIERADVERILANRVPSASTEVVHGIALGVRVARSGRAIEYPVLAGAMRPRLPASATDRLPLEIGIGALAGGGGSDGCAQFGALGVAGTPSAASLDSAAESCRDARDPASPAVCLFAASGCGTRQWAALSPRFRRFVLDLVTGEARVAARSYFSGDLDVSGLQPRFVAVARTGELSLAEAAFLAERAHTNPQVEAEMRIWVFALAHGDARVRSVARALFPRSSVQIRGLAIPDAVVLLETGTTIVELTASEAGRSRYQHVGRRATATLTDLLASTEWSDEHVEALRRARDALQRSADAEIRARAPVAERAARQVDPDATRYAEVVWWLKRAGVLFALHFLLWIVFLVTYPHSTWVAKTLIWNATWRNAVGFVYAPVVLLAVPRVIRRMLRPFEEQLRAGDRQPLSHDELRRFYDQLTTTSRREGQPNLTLAQLRDAAARGSGSRVTVVVGPAGSGKTYLARWIARVGIERRLVALLRAQECGDDIAAVLVRRMGDDITDHELAKRMLLSGAVYVVVDGYADVSSGHRERIRSFFQRNAGVAGLITSRPTVAPWPQGWDVRNFGVVSEESRAALFNKYDVSQEEIQAHPLRDACLAAALPYEISVLSLLVRRKVALINDDIEKSYLDHVEATHAERAQRSFPSRQWAEACYRATASNTLAVEIGADGDLRDVGETMAAMDVGELTEDALLARHQRFIDPYVAAFLREHRAEWSVHAGDAWFLGAYLRLAEALGALEMDHLIATVARGTQGTDTRDILDALVQLPPRPAPPAAPLELLQEDAPAGTSDS